MKSALIRVRLIRNRCPLSAKGDEKRPEKGFPDSVLVYSGPEANIDWETENDCPGPHWRVHESSVKAAFGRYYDNCPPVYVCGHQIEID